MRPLHAALLRRSFTRRADLLSLFATRTFTIISSDSALLPPPPPPPPLPLLLPVDVDSAESPFPEEPAESLSARMEKLPKEHPVVSAFQSWMGDGFPVHRGDVFHAINRLRKLGLNKRALEVKLAQPLIASIYAFVFCKLGFGWNWGKSGDHAYGLVMEWVIRERPYKLKELEYAYLLEFTTKLHGISSGEKLFTHIPAEFQNELLYNNLVMACLDKGVVRLSLAHMKRMRELGFTIAPYVYNRLIILHSSPDRRKMIPKILSQMKADRVSPHTSTYNILLKIEADDHNIEGLSKVFADMKKAKIEPNEITYGILATAHAVAKLYVVSEFYVEAIEKTKTGDNWSTFDILLILYGYLGKDKELQRTWKAMEGLPHIRSQSFCLAIEAFGRLSHIDRSEELWAEMKSIRQLKSTKQFNSMISVYCRHGLLEKASELFKEMEATGCNPNAITYRHLTLCCLKAGCIKEALKTLEAGKDQAVSFQVRKSIPWLETTHSILDAFAEMGDLENAKKFFLELKESRYSRYAFVHNTLLRAHIKAKVYDPYLLKKMILGGARPDAETYSLLRLMEHFKS
ncbi:hypothetical protein Taro_047202 [Colocasia esculenta]|uniref:Pentatricopeptide repeat-containing protein n=1 Tax=Colocasia esculenta TaxID=4460 RepID=A0A843X7U1_COLES|nr:hypothetical protein [Colocasia esculenta]